jgi:membrane-bound serine protease (ClpP class)
MRRPLLAVFFSLAFLLVMGSARAEGGAKTGAAEPVEVVKVDGVIDQPVADYLIGSLLDAERRGSTVIIQLNTPGTLGVSPIQLAERVFRARVPVVVWVGPPGSHTAGGGLLLVYASSYALTSPGSGIGPLDPLDLATKPHAENPAARVRALALIRHWAAERGRDPSFAASGREAPGVVVLRRHVVEDFATSIGTLMTKLDGRSVRTSTGRVTLHTDPSAVILRFHELGPGRRALHAVASPVAIYVLLLLGIAGVAFEVTQAGIGVAGIAGAVAIGFAVYGLIVVPFSPLGLGIFLGGQALLTADVLLRRLGPLTFAGLAAFASGSVLVFGGVAAAIDIPVWLIAVSTLACFLYYGFALTVAQRSRDRITSTRRGLVGLVGEARGTLAPEGPVFVKGTLWRGRAMDGPIPRGARIRVRGVEGLTLRVEPEDGPEHPEG